jgi:hypothetical protein
MIHQIIIPHTSIPDKDAIFYQCKAFQLNGNEEGLECLVTVDAH